MKRTARSEELPGEEVKASLDELVAFLQSREGGGTILFSGPPGTGKTMAAELLATRLQLNLYRADLSQVVSKYIGETEKNLRKVFDAVEVGGSILFFDEADALFAKRTEVKDSHDRYSNLEVGYLLGRVIGYAGISVIAVESPSDFLRGLIDFAIEFGEAESAG